MKKQRFEIFGIESICSQRGLDDVLEYGLKCLLVTADAQDVRRLAAICDRLHAFELKMVHAVDHQFACLRVLSEATEQTCEKYN